MELYEYKQIPVKSEHFVQILQRSMWSKNHTKMSFTVIEKINLQFAFLLSVLWFFFTKLLNVEAKDQEQRSLKSNFKRIILRCYKEIMYNTEMNKKQKFYSLRKEWKLSYPLLLMLFIICNINHL